MASRIFRQSLSFLVVSHLFINPGALELENFLREKARYLFFVGHPLFKYSRKKNSFSRLYENGVLEWVFEAPKISGPDSIRYLKDFLLTIGLAIASRRRFNIYIGLGGFNALTGLVLRYLGIVQKIAFYCIDYTPRRFENPVMNALYHAIDTVCATRCDIVWNLSSAMHDMRSNKGSKKRMAPAITVPIGTGFDEIKRRPFEEIDRRCIVYAGHLIEDQGIELIIDALPDLVKKIPCLRMIIIGSGPLKERIEQRIRLNGLEGSVHFAGDIEDHKDVEDILTKCAVGLAPYRPSPENKAWFTDPTKPKMYMACGLPVVIGRVPKIALEITRRHAGIAISYDKHELVRAVTNLLSAEQVLAEYRRNAISLASEYRWNEIFSTAIAESITLMSRRSSSSM